MGDRKVVRKKKDGGGAKVRKRKLTSASSFSLPFIFLNMAPKNHLLMYEVPIRTCRRPSTGAPTTSEEVASMKLVLDYRVSIAHEPSRWFISVNRGNKFKDWLCSIETDNTIFNRWSRWHFRSQMLNGNIRSALDRLGRSTELIRCELVLSW